MTSQYTSADAAQFERSKTDHQKYPTNVIRTETFGYALESYRKRLDDERLFDTKNPLLGFMDLFTTNSDFRKFRPLRTLEMLEREVDKEDGTPFWRLVFLQSASSRGSLCCTREQLTFLFTYYQVMPSFLDFIFTFKIRAKPVTYASFRHENYLEKDNPAFALPELGRSGRQIQHGFNILYVERASEKDEKNQWPFRQVAIYHSFDVTNGRCVLIILKRNQSMAKRIDSALKSHRSLRVTAITNPESSFIASLQLHMVVLEWCTESWAEYVDYLEQEVEIENVVEGLKINIPDRHHLFFIDDSTSMGTYAKSVSEALVGLQAVTRKLEVRRTELSFASDPKLLKRTNRTQKLASRLDKHQYRREPEVMENCLSRLIDDVIIPRLPVNFYGLKCRFNRWGPTSIYIFTDGNWGDQGSAACGVENPVERLIEELKARRLDKNEVTLHFISFGNDENGRLYLRHLDELGSLNGRDNVDVKNVSSSVQTIILGPISQANDRRGE